MPVVVVLSRLRFPNSMDGNVVILLSEFMDVTLHMRVSRILLSRNGLGIVVKAARHGLGSACMCCSMESTGLVSFRHVLDRHCKGPFSLRPTSGNHFSTPKRGTFALCIRPLRGVSRARSHGRPCPK